MVFTTINPSSFCILSMASSFLLFELSKYFTPLITASYLLLNSKTKIDWDFRYHSSLHAAVSTILSVIALKEFAQQELNVVLWTTPLTESTLMISLGYFLADSLLMLRHPQEGNNMMLVHHSVALACLIAALYLQSCHLYAIFALTSECTTPSINLRWILHTMGLKNSQIYAANGIVLMISWPVIRVFFFSYIFKHLYDNYDLLHTLPTGIFELIFVSSAILFLMNIVWGMKILKGGLRVIFVKKEKI